MHATLDACLTGVEDHEHAGDLLVDPISNLDVIVISRERRNIRSRSEPDQAPISATASPLASAKSLHALCWMKRVVSGAFIACSIMSSLVIGSSWLMCSSAISASR